MKIDGRIAPNFAYWRKTDARRQPRRNHEQRAIFILSRESENTLREGAAAFDRLVIAVREKFEIVATKLQQLLREKNFDSSVNPVFKQLRGRRAIFD